MELSFLGTKVPWYESSSYPWVLGLGTEIVLDRMKINYGYHVFPEARKILGKETFDTQYDMIITTS